MWRANMKNINEEDEEEEDTWELARAFDEDTRTTMGNNWPPRSYSCTFCRREFRSAQALGGHMNIHRRDRARQAQAQPQSQTQTTAVGSTSSSESLISWANLGGGSGALVYNYQLSNYGANDSFGGTNYSPNNDNYEMKITEISNYEENYGIVKLNKEEVPVEELDLELRLGHTPVSDGRLMKKKKKNNNVAILHWR